MEKRIFDYGKFFNELKDNTDKNEMALKYEKVFGSQRGLKVEDQPFYKEYLSQFAMPFWVAIPKDCDYDWDLLFSFIFGSFSSEYSLVLEDEWIKNPQSIPMIQIYISAHSGERLVSKCLDELTDFQIYHLLEIYTSEQMDLALLKEDDIEGREECIEDQREKKLSLAQNRLTRVAREAKSILTLKQLIPAL